MKTVRFNKFLQENINVIIPVILTGLVIVVGGFAEYLTEYKQPGANITNFNDALWWSVITITTVGYGDYTPVTPLGRIIATIVMFVGIGIAVTLVTVIAQKRVERAQERLMSKTVGKGRILAIEMKATIQDKVEGIEKLTEEDFDGLVVMMKSLRLTLLEESTDVHKCPKCGSDYRSKPKFCSNCGFALNHSRPI
ncbi:MAG TPA: ion channel [Nitrososphaera sp.]